MSATPPPMMPPPQWHPQPSFASTLRPIDIFDFGAVLGAAWDAMKRAYGPLLLAVLMMGAAWFVGAVVGMCIPFGGQLLAAFFAAPIAAGAIMLTVRALRGEKTGAAMLFAAFGPRYWQLMGVYWMKVLISLCGYVPLFAGAVMLDAGTRMHDVMQIVLICAGAAAIIAGLVLLVIINIRLQFAELLCIDADLGPIGVMDALKQSWRLTGRLSFSLIGLAILVAVFALATVLLLVIGVFLLGLPYAFAATGAAYVWILGPLRISWTHCRACGYSFAGLTPERCPECGAPPESASAPFACERWSRWADSAASGA